MMMMKNKMKLTRSPDLVMSWSSAICVHRHSHFLSSSLLASASVLLFLFLSLMRLLFFSTFYFLLSIFYFLFLIKGDCAVFSSAAFSLSLSLVC